ncbi:AAA family ATPase [Alkalimonas collagenimarina]|uniref:AAA family ATPase n=1 Tax=Alkalimonas collagenimarina TaxID=400390 RepID=A0ABT9GY68_9GAMM|nr:AAA family ATPase [Alkalimonas collagenimarina]MDP4536002.1 AAA family ATPase [Alkalimonas collagenimarina]
MERALLAELLIWKEKSKRKPLLIDGARQTGKTYLLQELLGQHFKQVLRIDFLESPHMAEAFTGSLAPEDVLSAIELLMNKQFNAKTDLLILDEIGECPHAVTALKYFAEKAPHMFVAASGSNIGLLNTFPVGKVEQYNLRPLTFREFLLAANQPALINTYDNAVNSTAAHSKLFEKLTEYYFTGGMPEAVSCWFAMADNSILERVKAVSRIHADLISGYSRDFGKYSGKVDAGLIAAIFNAVPSQLAAVLDESVKRFKFKQVHERKSRYQELESGINWLEKCRLILRNYPVEGVPRSPLAAYKKDNKVKLFLLDVGLLNHMLGVSYLEIKQQSYEYKGYIAENFIQQELAALGIEPTFSWSDARAEIEFVIADQAGNIIPIEVKSGKRTRAKSLQSYIDKCAPIKTIKLTGTQGSSTIEQQHFVYPLYYAVHAVKKHLMN